METVLTVNEYCMYVEFFCTHFTVLLKLLGYLVQMIYLQQQHLSIKLMLKNVFMSSCNHVHVIPTRDGRYHNFDVDAISICKASIYQYITIFITLWTCSLNLCKYIKYTAFCFNFLCFVDLNLPLLLKTATLWTLLLPWLTSNPEINLFAIYIFY